MHGFRVGLVGVVVLGAWVLLLPVAGVLAIQALLKILFRGTERLLQLRLRPTPEWIQFDPVVGYRMVGGLDCHHTYHTDAFRLRTCPDGWPGAHRVSEADVIVFGDSYAVGIGVDHNRTYYGRGRNPYVKPVAAQGYNMVQCLLLMRELAPHLANRLVVWFICLENDLSDNLSPAVHGQRIPFVTEGPGGWRIASAHLAAERWTASLGRLRSRAETMRAIVQLYQPGHASDRAFGAAAYLIAEAQAAVACAGGRLMVLTIPPPHVFLPRPLLARVLRGGQMSAADDIDLERPDRLLANVCHGVGVEFVAGSHFFELGDFINVGDMHWNERGHRKLRRLLDARHREHLQALASPPIQRRHQAPASGRA